ncbi:MAG TPA: amino acid adenylation domain-containing protein [Longimicrobium sp.]|nr:amino acid adenylation domain-containing protein [Longimicrobium sp.]
MTVERAAAGLSRGEKQEMLRRMLLERASRARTAPASFAQERLWFLDRLQPGNAFYNVPTALRLRGELNVPALERALAEVVRRHEVLRTVFREEDGAPLQVISPFAGFALPVDDLSAIDPGAREAVLARRASEHGELPFDLAAGPLFRARLLRLAEPEHALLLCAHHAVADEWSLRVLYRELFALYGAFCQGLPSPLAELPAQYADYAAWQRQALRGDALERQLAWWKERLAGAPALLELPADRPRPPVQSFRGATERMEVPAALVERLHAVARGESATLFMAALAAFKVLLSKYGAGDDIVVGSPITGRTRTEVEGLIGFFLNTLALRTELGGDPTFRQVVRRVREGALGAWQHQDLPFERLVEALHPERSLSYSPLFQAMFVLNEGEREAGGAGGGALEVSGVVTETTTSKFDLTLALAVKPSGSLLTLEYGTDLWDRATIVRMMAHYTRLLEQAAAAPDTPLSRLRLAGDGELAQIEGWNRTAAQAPAVTLHALWEAQAGRTPHAVAVTHGDVSLTYRELDRRANRLAHHLTSLGVGVDERVGLCLERGVEMLVAVLGILKAGAAYVPLDPAYPAERLSHMLRNSAARVIVTQRGLAERLPAGGATLVRVDADAAEIARQSADRPRLPVAPGNLAYVIYTSGSTGEPKGVAMPHEPLVNLITWQSGDWRRPGAAVTLQFASISFDVSFQEMFSCWATGGRLVLVGEEMRYDPSRLLELVERQGVERLFIPAVALQQLAETAGARRIAPPRLREVQTAGEQVRVTEPMRRWFQALRAPLHNQYGPSETHVVTRKTVEGNAAAWPDLPSIGQPIANTRCHVVDAALFPAPVGVPGELFIGGVGVARGYLGRPALTAERFIPDPFAREPGARLYRTGDRARWRADGEIEFLGRVDEQVKVRGFRIEPAEVEAALATHPAVRKAVVVAREDVPGDRRLVAYVVAEGPADAMELRTHLKARLPEYMVPATVVQLDALPLTPSGKVARRALPAPQAASADEAFEAPRVPLEETIAGVWAQVLGREAVSVHTNFFDLGGHSMSLVRVQARLRDVLQREIPVVDLFRHPTVAALASHLEGGAKEDADRSATDGRASAEAAASANRAADGDGAIAIIGMAGRFPGAADVGQFWSNLRDGVHSVVSPTDEELLAAGVSPALLRDPRYVRATGMLEGIDRFDAAFFGFNPREAEVLDPQHRLFLEAAWEALENAGYAPGATDAEVGVYAGSAASSYLQRHVQTHPDIVEALGALQVEIANGKDFLASRTAYKLNVHGPAVSVQTACSTGLVAVHLACRALAAGECGMALAGGVGLRLIPGHTHAPGGITSPDGFCRAFDERAAGTVNGSGVAIVVLKRLADALADGDTIHAVVRGSAINNDGGRKVGYTAPGVQGQAEVIQRALAAAGVEPEAIGYVEAHGSGTELGDPIEVAALAEAFGRTKRTQACALGSVKTNVGHLDAAAGVAGLIKAALAVEHGEIPPTLHFTRPNPRIDFANSPFFVNPELRPWPVEGPRRAGVSSFGIGGTNAHVVLEEAPARRPSEPAREWQLIPLSARTPRALDAAAERLAAHLRDHPDQPLADVAWTLQAGRKAFEHRRVVVACDHLQAAEILESRAPDRVFTARAPERAREVAFIFPGLGNHFAGMGQGLYEAEPIYREAVDRCAEILRPHLGVDLREVLYPKDAPPRDTSGTVDLRGMLGRAGDDEAPDALGDTRFAQPALFVTEYALVQLWMHWGVRPGAMVGHSLGEYVAATVAGVWSLEDALMLVAERARLIQELPAGGMMGLVMTEEEVTPLLRDGLCIGARNGPRINVVSGPAAAVDALQAEMTAQGIACRRLPTKHAFHSSMMEPVAARLARLLRGIQLNAPGIPFASNVTGTWITAADATDPAYWTRHLCGTVRFSEGVETLARDGYRLLLEAGPGKTLGFLATQMDIWGDTPPTLVISLPHKFERHSDSAFVQGAAGRLWASGAAVDWHAMHAHERLGRVPLPTYPFERERYWLEPRALAPAAPRGGDPLARKPDPADWLYVPVWTHAPLSPASAEPIDPAASIEPAAWLVLADEAGVGAHLAARLETRGHTVVLVHPGDGFARLDVGYTAAPGSPEDLIALRDALRAEGISPRGIVHLWGIDPAGEDVADAFERAQARGYASVAAIATAFAAESSDPLRLVVVTDGVHDVSGGERVRPERSTVIGACLVLPQEHPHVACHTVDVRFAPRTADRLADQLAAELEADTRAPVALRGARRWEMGFQPARPRADAAGLVAGGAYLFSGGIAGGAGVLMEHLAGMEGARIAVLVDEGFPDRAQWDDFGDSAPGALIGAIRAAEARGARTLLLRADRHDAAAVRAAVLSAREEFGELHGVVHVAGLGPAGALGPLAGRSSVYAVAELARVAHELSIVIAATEDLPLHFRLLQNSIFSVFGGAGLAVAAAAYVLMDAWVQHAAAHGGGWTSVNWDRWHLGEGGGALAERAILRDDGERVYQALAALAGEPRVVVSTHDLTARVERLRAPRAVRAAEGGEEGAEGGLYARPSLETGYQAPATEAEQLLAGIWGELLGIREIGVRDSFFDLGGHSLIGMQVLSRVRETFQVDLPLRVVFEAATIADLAAVIDDVIVQELSAMSDEEAEAALAGVEAGR